MSYKLNGYNESILIDKSFFKAVDFFDEDVNNNLNFDKFITNYKVIKAKIKVMLRNLV